ncbi:MAG TPA: EMC3/TMCO1 family protein [Methanomassiliicoccales archaeon]|jgi:uncharacterized membrane protein (DUF106 family)
MAEKIASSTPAASTAPAAAPKGGMSRMVTIFIFVLAIFILFDNSLRSALGTAVGYGLDPLVSFNHAYPVLTFVITGLLMAALTIVVRHFFTDYVEQARSQKIVSAFNKELRDARKENNSFKMKKLLAEQPKIMQKSMAQTTTQFKLLPVSMIIVIPIFAWLSVFVTGLSGVYHPGTTVSMLYYSVPWSNVANFNEAYLFPQWVLVYTLVSIPFGQVLSRALRYFSFARRLKELRAAKV